jgi:alpha-1,2-mannosyltransferase
LLLVRLLCAVSRRLDAKTEKSSRFSIPSATPAAAASACSGAPCSRSLRHLHARRRRRVHGRRRVADEILALAASLSVCGSIHRVRFVRLRTRFLLEARHYPYFSLAAQSAASVLVAIEAAWRCVPDVFVDSMGFAFTFPLMRSVVGATVACYVHYPTISTDMLDAVVSARPNAVHNAGAANAGALRTRAKLIYYRIFARCYGWAGSNARVVMTNSSWTDAHIRSLWRVPSRVVYPPCDTSELSRMPLEPRRNEILSVAQFRPEKDHALQLRAFALLLRNEPQLVRSSL